VEPVPGTTLLTWRLDLAPGETVVTEAGAMAWMSPTLSIKTSTRGGIMAGLLLAFARALGEFGATSFVARPATVTMPVMIFRLLSRPGPASFGMAMALSVVLAAMTAAVVMWIDRLEVGDIGAF